MALTLAGQAAAFITRPRNAGTVDTLPGSAGATRLQRLWINTGGERTVWLDPRGKLTFWNQDAGKPPSSRVFPPSSGVIPLSSRDGGEPEGHLVDVEGGTDPAVYVHT